MIDANEFLYSLERALQCCGSILLCLYVIFGYILHKNDQTSDGDYGDEDDPDNTPEVISQRENKKNVRNVSSNIIAVVYVIAGFVLEYMVDKPAGNFLLPEISIMVLCLLLISVIISDIASNICCKGDTGRGILTASTIRSHDDLMKLYRQQLRSEKIKFTGEEKLINLIAILFASAAGLCMIMNRKELTIICYVGSVLSVVIMFIHYEKAEVKDENRKKWNEFHENRLVILIKSLPVLGIDYKNHDQIKEYLDFCKEQRDKSGKDKSVSRFWLAALSVFIVPFFLLLVEQLGNKQSNPISLVRLFVAVFFIIFAVIMICFAVYQIMTPVLNRAETEYDSFIREVEELAIFNNSERIKKIEQRVNGDSETRSKIAHDFSAP